MSKTADQWKSEGNTFLQSGQFDEAIEAYTQVWVIHAMYAVFEEFFSNIGYFFRFSFLFFDVVLADSIGY